MSLAEFPWRDFDVEFAVLFGSRSGGRRIKGDWDVAVWLNDVGKYADLLAALAKFLGVREEDVDLVALNHRLPCSLIVEILRRRPIYVRDWERYLDIRFRLQNPCVDFLIGAARLGLEDPLWLS
ncbi:MAG: nucleotidyltransferase domain-containing protein [Thermoproteus sp.]